MARKVVVYKMHGKNTPYYIKDGGHFYHYIKHKGNMIGVTKDEDECHIPASLTVMANVEELKAYVVDLDLTSHRPEEMGVELTTVQKEAIAVKFWNDRGL